jgi:hypothetical protein
LWLTATIVAEIYEIVWGSARTDDRLMLAEHEEAGERQAGLTCIAVVAPAAELLQLILVV